MTSKYEKEFRKKYGITSATTEANNENKAELPDWAKKVSYSLPTVKRGYAKLPTVRPERNGRIELPKDTENGRYYEVPEKKETFAEKVKKVSLPKVKGTATPTTYGQREQTDTSMPYATGQTKDVQGTLNLTSGQRAVKDIPRNFVSGLTKLASTGIQIVSQKDGSTERLLTEQEFNAQSGLRKAGRTYDDYKRYTEAKNSQNEPLKNIKSLSDSMASEVNEDTTLGEKIVRGALQSVLPSAGTSAMGGSIASAVGNMTANKAVIEIARNSPLFLSSVDEGLGDADKLGLKGTERATYAVGSGLIQTITERISVPGLEGARLGLTEITKKGLRESLFDLAKSFVNEGGTEGLATFSTQIMQQFGYGVEQDWQKNIEEILVSAGSGAIMGGADVVGSMVTGVGYKTVGVDGDKVIVETTDGRVERVDPRILANYKINESKRAYLTKNQTEETTKEIIPEVEPNVTIPTQEPTINQDELQPNNEVSTHKELESVTEPLNEVVNETLKTEQISPEIKNNVPEVKKVSLPKVKKQPYEMTLKQYQNDFLNNSKYGAKYKTDENLRTGKLKDLQIEWENKLIKQAEIGVIPERVMRDYVALYGEEQARRTFKGTLSKGMEAWEATQVNKMPKTTDFKKAAEQVTETSELDKLKSWVANVEKNEIQKSSKQNKAKYDKVVEKIRALDPTFKAETEKKVKLPRVKKAEPISKELEHKIQKEVDSAGFEKAMKKMGYKTLDDLSEQGQQPPKQINVKGLLRPEMYMNQRHQMESLQKLYTEQLGKDKTFTTLITEQYNKELETNAREKLVEDSFGKEDWEVPREIILERGSAYNGGVFVGDIHKRAVEQAIKEGKPVPDEVLADYPELEPIKKAEPPKPKNITKEIVEKKFSEKVMAIEKDGKYTHRVYDVNPQDVARFNFTTLDESGKTINQERISLEELTSRLNKDEIKQSKIVPYSLKKSIAQKNEKVAETTEKLTSNKMEMTGTMIAPPIMPKTAYQDEMVGFSETKTSKVKSSLNNAEWVDGNSKEILNDNPMEYQTVTNNGDRRYARSKIESDFNATFEEMRTKVKEEKELSSKDWMTLKELQKTVQALQKENPEVSYEDDKNDIFNMMRTYSTSKGQGLQAMKDEMPRSERYYATETLEETVQDDIDKALNPSQKEDVKVAVQILDELFVEVERNKDGTFTMSDRNLDKLVEVVTENFKVHKKSRAIWERALKIDLKKERITKTQVLDKISEILKIPRLTTPEANAMMDALDNMQKTKKNSVDYWKAKTELDDMIALSKADWIDKVNAWQVTAMLGNIPTAGRNQIGTFGAVGAIKPTSDIAAYFIDRIKNVHNNKVNIAPPILNPVNYVKYWGQGQYKIWYDFVNNVNIGSAIKGEDTDNSKYEVGSTRVFNNKVAHTYYRFTKALLSDYPHKLAIYNMEMDRISLGEAQAKEKKQKFNGTLQRQLVNDITEEYTFNNKTGLSKMLTSVVADINLLTGDRRLGLGTVLARFARTQMNIVNFTADHLGVDVLRQAVVGKRNSYKYGLENAAEMRQINMTKAQAKAISGVALLALGAWLSSHGIIIDEEEDEDKKKMLEAQGIKGAYLNTSALARYAMSTLPGGEPIFDKSLGEIRDGDQPISILFAQPLATHLLMGSRLSKMQKGEGFVDVVGKFVQVFGESISDFVEMPMSRTIDTLTDDNLSGSQKFAKIFGGVLTGFIPSPIKKATQAFDPYSKKISRNAGEGFVQTVKTATLPVLRKQVPNWFDVTGKSVPYYNTDSKLGALLQAETYPWYGGTVEVDPDMKRMVEQYDKGTLDELPTTLKDYFNSDGIKYELNATQHQKFQELYFKAFVQYSKTKSEPHDQAYKDAKAQILTELKKK